MSVDWGMSMEGDFCASQYLVLVWTLHFTDGKPWLKMMKISPFALIDKDLKMIVLDSILYNSNNNIF